MKLTQEISNITSHHITVMLLFGTKWNRIDVVRMLIFCHLHLNLQITDSQM